MNKVENILGIIIKVRKEKGLTQEQVAKRLGITRKTYATYEGNKAKITLEVFFKILDILEIDTKDIFHTQPNISKEDINNLFDTVKDLKDRFDKTI